MVTCSSKSSLCLLCCPGQAHAKELEELTTAKDDLARRERIMRKEFEAQVARLDAAKDDLDEQEERLERETQVADASASVALEEAEAERQ